MNRVATPSWLDRKKTYKMLQGKKRYSAYRAFVMMGNDAHTDDFYTGDFQTGIFGDNAFRQSIHEERENLKATEGLSALVAEQITIQEIVDVVAIVFDTTSFEIVRRRLGRQSKNVPRRMAMYCSQQLGDHSLKAIASHFSLTHSGSASTAINSIKRQLEKGELTSHYNQILNDLNVIK